MIKKILIVFALLWVAFLGIIVILEFRGETQPPEKIVQEVVAPVSSPPPVKMVPEIIETIPFQPLPNKSVSPEPLLVKEEKKKEVLLPVKAPVDKVVDDTGQKSSEVPFGLICTKYEKVPSRFRLVSWAGTKEVQVEDLSQVNSSTKKRPLYWFKLRVPYKEFIHNSTKETFFRPTRIDDPNKRILAQSFEIRHSAINFSANSQPIGYLILRDFKIGGSPYQLTSEMENPMTSAHYLHFEQIMGPKKFFHDLTGKRNGHKFGGWGIEYQVTHHNLAQNKITILRKDTKTLKSTKKDLSGPSSL